MTLGSFGNPDIIADQAARESDPLITHVALTRSGPPIYRWSLRGGGVSS